MTWRGIYKRVRTLFGNGDPALRRPSADANAPPTAATGLPAVAGVKPALLPRDIILGLPNDHARQVQASYYIPWLAARLKVPAPRIIDLGAGAGTSYDTFKKSFKTLNWLGVDIEESPEVRSRKRTDIDFAAYDGINIPAEDGSIDAIYSRQVFEHVRHPEELLRDIARVLKPGGYFVGSVSQLEPYHSYSFGSFTYYGFATFAAEAGLSLVEFRPGVDALTLIRRNFRKFQMHVDVKRYDRWIRGTSPLNAFIDRKYADLSPREINARKLAYCGHLCFAFQKPAPRRKRGRWRQK